MDQNSMWFCLKALVCLALVGHYPNTNVESYKGLLYGSTCLAHYMLNMATH